jgi:hypothetical protein
MMYGINIDYKVGNVLLYFSTLSGAFQLKTPLPPYLPPAEQAREKLVDAVRQLKVVKNKDIKASKHLLFFAYVILMSKCYFSSVLCQPEAHHCRRWRYQGA